jgi:hypothetical protein
MTGLLIVGMVAGAGWMLFGLSIWGRVMAWRGNRARHRAIDQAVAKNRVQRGAPPINRQQRRAIARAKRKGAR